MLEIQSAQQLHTIVFHRAASTVLGGFQTSAAWVMNYRDAQYAAAANLQTVIALCDMFGILLPVSELLSTLQSGHSIKNFVVPSCWRN